MKCGTLKIMSSCHDRMWLCVVNEGCVSLTVTAVSLSFLFSFFVFVFFIAGGSWWSIVNGPCSVSSPSSAGSETRFWPGDQSDWASARAAAASLCWCKRWRRTPSPAPWSDTSSTDTSSCASSGHLGGWINKGQMSPDERITREPQQDELRRPDMGFGVQVFRPGLRAPRPVNKARAC